jgi:hypothetical protein
VVSLFPPFLRAARTKRKIEIAELEEWREKAYHSAKLYKERTKRWHSKRVKTKQFKPRDIVLSLTLTFLYLVMVSFVVSGQAHT